MTAATGFRAPHPRREHPIGDSDFEAGPEPGEPFPDFDLRTVSRHRIRKADYVGQRPLLLLCGSIALPTEGSAAAGLRRLYDEFGDRVAFVTLHVSETGGGDPDPQAETFEQKLVRGRDYQYREQIPWPVAIDDPDATLQRALDASVNSAYVMARDGTVAFRTSRADDVRSVGEALGAVTVGDSPGQQRQPGRASVVGPALRVSETRAEEDDLGTVQVRSVPVRERLAAAFHSLPAPARGAASLAAGLLPVAVAVGVLKMLRRRAD